MNTYSTTIVYNLSLSVFKSVTLSIQWFCTTWALEAFLLLIFFNIAIAIPISQPSSVGNNQYPTTAFIP